MGIPIEPDDPAWLDCPDCCSNLPDTLDASLEVPGVGTFTGTITKDPSDDCFFSGLLSYNAQTTPFIAVFCINPDGDTDLYTAGPIFAQCGGAQALGNNCYPYITERSAGNCLYKVTT